MKTSFALIFLLGIVTFTASAKEVYYTLDWNVQFNFIGEPHTVDFVFKSRENPDITVDMGSAVIASNGEADGLVILDNGPNELARITIEGEFTTTTLLAGTKIGALNINGETILDPITLTQDTSFGDLVAQLVVVAQQKFATVFPELTAQMLEAMNTAGASSSSVIV